MPDGWLFQTSSFIIYHIISTFEFICAQSPYSMRGLLFGTGYGSVVVFNILEYGLIHPFIRLSFTYGTGVINIIVNFGSYC